MIRDSSSTQVYFDCNATTPVLRDAATAALQAMETLYGNPSSTHLVGVQAKAILESTRKITAQLIGASPGEIIYTSGATEGIQTAIFSALQHWKKQYVHQKLKLLYGATEHKAVPEALAHWLRVLDLNYEVIKLPVDSRGQIRLTDLEKNIKDAALLCTMAVNNETGVIQDLDRIEELLHSTESNALWMVDCVQALGKLDLSLSQTRINYAPFSGHKLYAPKGIGFLYLKHKTPFTPLLVGGGQEYGYRSGTENLPGVAALGAVLSHFLGEGALLKTNRELECFRDQLVRSLKLSFPKIEFNTPFDCSVPTTINFSIPGLSSSELLALFDSAGIRLSSGSACSSSSVKPSYVLEAMGVPLSRSSSAIRLSFGPFTEQEEVDQACILIEASAKALQDTCILESPESFKAPQELRDGIIQLKVGANNSWIIVDQATSSCVVIDPCEEVSQRIESFIHCQNLKPLAILDTHQHADHESIRPHLQKNLLSVRNQELDLGEFDSLGWPLKLTQLVKLSHDRQIEAIILNQGDINSPPKVLARLKTPGHTDDSVTYLYGTLSENHELESSHIRAAFTGDTILSGGLGRTNFAVSSAEALFYSLREIDSVISDQTLLCPAHDYDSSFATSLQVEKDENSLLREALAPYSALALQSFLMKKRDIDQQLGGLEQNFQAMVCGVTSSQVKTIASSCPSLEPGVFFRKLMTENASLLVDIREPQEHALFKDWGKLGLSSIPRNVPLSRIVNFMAELQDNLLNLPQDKHPQIILFCRTGNRSLQAAKSLRRLGFPYVWSIQGGVALWMNSSFNEGTA